jgi:hypothetical protein
MEQYPKRIASEQDIKIVSVEVFGLVVSSGFYSLTRLAVLVSP